MIKPIHKSDVVVRPFTTFKNWNLQNQTYDSLLTTEDGCPLFTWYVTQSDQPCNVNPCFASYSIATEVQDLDSRVKIIEGQSSSGIFYSVGDSFYDSTKNPTNRDGSYKRLIYNSTQKLFYNDFNNPLDLFGIQSYDSGNENRTLENSRIIVSNISNTTYGERIQSGSVIITDNSNVDQQIIMADDGFTNLIVQNSIFANEDQLGAPPIITGSSFYDPAHDRFGSKVSAWNNYIIVGAPLDNENFSQPKAGAAYLYKFDQSQNEYRFIKNFYSPFTQNGYATEVGFDSNNLLLTEIGFFLSLDNSSDNGGYAINDNFGEAVSLDSNVLAIGAPICDFCGDSSGSGQVYVYEKYKGGSDHWGIINVLEGSCSLDKFGSSVSVNGTKIAIGAPGANNGKGKVYIFKQDIYGVTVPTSSYWFVVDQETDICTNLVSETTQSVPINYTISGSSLITPISGGFQLTDYMSSDCNTTATFLSYPTTQSIFTGSLTTNLHIGGDEFFDIYSEDSTPRFITSNSIWNLEYVIETNTDELSYFGASLCLSGSYLIVGNNSPSSSVYLFESQSNGWVRTTRFDSDHYTNTVSCSSCSYPETDNIFNLYDESALSSNLSQSYFGTSVAIHNDTILIGAPFDLEFAPYSGSNDSYQVGSVYFYKKQTTSEILDYQCGLPITSSNDGCPWQLITKIYESSSIEFQNNRFGFSLAMDNDRFVVGSLYGLNYISSSFNPNTSTFDIQDYGTYSEGPLSNSNLNGRASVYKLQDSEDGYFSIEKVISKQKTVNSVKKSFGYSVAVDNNHIIVGSPLFMYGDDTGTELFLVDSGSIISGSFVSESFYLEQEYTGSQPSGTLFLGDYLTSGSFQPFTYDFNLITQYVPSSASGSIYIYDMNDLYVSHSAGNVFYKNGIVVINNTGSSFDTTFSGVNGTGYSIQFQGTHTIYEHEILCTINPGEFNVSTNPTSVVRNSIPYDINGDGIFDILDLDIIMRYYMKFTNLTTSIPITDDNGVVAESQPPEHWWGQEILLTESDDVIWLEPYVENGTLTEEELLANINSSLYQILLQLDQAGLLDINGDGVTSIEDSVILFNYFSGRRDSSLVDGNITANSTRTNATEVIEFLNTMTGVGNGVHILDTFLNYQESSSIDPTGSYLAPYITTIGLYQDNQLVAVAKLGQPIKNPINYPINFLIRYDT